MRKLLFLILLAAPAYCTPSVVQGCNNYNNLTAQTSMVCTFGSNITAGNTLYFCVQTNNNVAATFSGDSDTYVADPGAGTPITQILWWNGYVTCVSVAHATGGSAAITASWGSANNPGLVGIEIAGVNGLIDKSDASVSNNSSATAVASNNITTTVPGDLLIGIAYAGGNPTVTAGTNVAWALITNAHNTLMEQMESFIQPATGAVNATFTIGTATQAWSHIVAFKPVYGIPVVY